MPAPARGRVGARGEAPRAGRRGGIAARVSRPGCARSADRRGGRPRTRSPRPSVPDREQPVGHGRLERDRVARPELVGLKTDRHPEPALDDVPVLVAGVAHQRILADTTRRPRRRRRSRKSTSCGVCGVRRSHRTPDASSIALPPPGAQPDPTPPPRRPARPTASGAAARLPVRWRSARGRRPPPAVRRLPKSSSSSDSPSSLTIAYSVPTDGDALPSSTCEIRLAETPTRRASSRTPIFWRRRSSRTRRPTLSGPTPLRRRLAGRGFSPRAPGRRRFGWRFAAWPSLQLAGLYIGSPTAGRWSIPSRSVTEATIAPAPGRNASSSGGL